VETGGGAEGGGAASGGGLTPAVAAVPGVEVRVWGVGGDSSAAAVEGRGTGGGRWIGGAARWRWRHLGRRRGRRRRCRRGRRVRREEDNRARRTTQSRNRGVHM
jgi:hypothetical protein